MILSFISSTYGLTLTFYVAIWVIMFAIFTIMHYFPKIWRVSYGKIKEKFKSFKKDPK